MTSSQPEPEMEMILGLVDMAAREEALRRLAEFHGVGSLIVLVGDPKTGTPRPPRGILAPLPGSRPWRDFFRLCREQGAHAASVAEADGTIRSLRAWTGAAGDCVILVDPPAGLCPRDLRGKMLLALALFRAEFEVEGAEATAQIAREAIAESARLVTALDGTRRHLAEKAQALGDALSQAELANQALQYANALVEAERQSAEHAANTDALTTTLSRAAFERRLAQSVETARRCGRPLALMLIDLDGFKEINDTCGHAAGDAVLKTVGERLKANCSDGAFVGRLGGDEFALVVPDMRADAGTWYSDRIRNLIAADIRYEGTLLSVRGTMGLASLLEDADTALDLLRKADIALYVAKRSNKGTLGRYSSEVEFQFNERARAIATLRRAVEERRIVAHYQPKVSLADGRVVGFEALARICGSDGQILGTGQFHAAFSDQESMRLLGTRMAETVLADMGAVRAAGHRLHPVAINVSGPEICSGVFVRELLDRIDRAAIDARLIEVEITETALLRDHPASLRSALATLRAAGVRIALDDFGTGYSSLSHLLDWEVDSIKIDRSFIVAFAHAPQRSAHIVQSLVGMAEKMGLAVVAEGVETGAEAGKLEELGCQYAQGYYFGRPVPAREAFYSSEAGVSRSLCHHR